MSELSTLPSAADPGREVPIGRPLCNLRAYVADRHLRPVPVGVVGQLLVAGVGLARGYLGRPRLTAECFCPDPFVDQPGSRLYQTGDLVRYRGDGSLEFLGRRDQQVKVRGYRIELGEIEAVLGRHPSVVQSAVVARDEGAGAGIHRDVRLVAYLVAAADPAPTVSELRDFLGETLPEYMVPAAFMVMEAFPLTPSGKLDRGRLPEPDRSRPELAAELALPESPIEEALAEMMQEVIGLEQVGVHDSFFELGGHSLLATQVVSRIRKTFELDLPLRIFFESPTIAELALAIEEELIARVEELEQQNPEALQ